MSTPFVWYSSSSKQAALLNTEPLSVPWLEGLLKLDGSKDYIELPVPYLGVGVLRLETKCTVTLENRGTGIAIVRLGIGVNYPNGANKPMYPYLGVSHGLGDATSEYWTLLPAQALPFTLLRWDIVDQKLQSDQPIPNWPKWEVLKGSGKAQLPVLSLCGNNDTPANPVWYRDVQMAVEVINS